MRVTAMALTLALATGSVGRASAQGDPPEAGVLGPPCDALVAAEQAVLERVFGEDGMVEREGWGVCHIDAQSAWFVGVTNGSRQPPQDEMEPAIEYDWELVRLNLDGSRASLRGRATQVWWDSEWTSSSRAPLRAHARL